MILKTISQRPFLITFLQIIGIAAAYFIAGKLGHLLAIPPNFATVVFPSSGIALASVLLYGKRAGLGVLLGAFLLNGAIPVTTNDLSEILNSAFMTLAISGGATLQAFAGAYLVRRFAGTPSILSNQRNILLFLFYGGLVSALVNSTFSVSLLVAAGKMPAETFFLNWLSWWSGDAIGIIIFAPLVLVWLSTGNSIWQGRKWAITLPIFIMFLLTAASVFYEIKTSNIRIKLEFNQRAKELSLVLESAMTTHLNVLRSFHSFYDSPSSIDRNEFRTFSSGQLKTFKSIQAVQWVPIILEENRDAYEKNVQQEGFPNFQITERNANNKIMRAVNRAEYAPVTFNEPYQGNEIVSGYDNYSSPLRHELLNKVRDTNELTASPPIKLIQEKGTQNGFLVYMPLYRSNLPHGTLEERRNAIASYIVLVFRAGDMITEAFKNQNLTELSYRLIDTGAPVTEQLLLTYNEFNPSTEELSIISRSTFDVGSRTWQFEIAPTANYLIQHRSTNIGFILVAGFLLMTLTIVNALKMAIRDNEKEARSVELALVYKKNKILDTQIHHMQKLESIGRLTSGVAHDFNNILMCMLGYNEINKMDSEDIEDESLRESIENNIHQINLAGKRGADLINKMLTYCRQENEGVKIMDVQPTQEVINEVLEMLRPALTSKINIKFEDSCSINQKDCGTCGIRNYCDLCIQMHSGDLHQILTNLAINARDSMREMGGVIAISLKKVRTTNGNCAACAAVLDGEFIELSVSDNGTGIEPKIIHRLFDPFFTTKPQGEGTGLGLSAVSGLVHQSGGHILVESNQSEFNHGTAFKLLFPISIDATK